MMTPTTYPEHDKLAAVKDNSQVIGEFLDWLQNEQSIALCKATGPDHCPFQPIHHGIQSILADYYDIDLDVIEQEKQAMLTEMRNLNEDTS